MQELNSITDQTSCETVCCELLEEIYKTGAVNFYDFTAGRFAADEESFKLVKSAASHLVKEKLACYTDEEHTTVSISNYGRYWILQGGYYSFLKAGHEHKEHPPEKTSNGKHHSKDELLEARLKLTHFRLIGFWLMIFLSLLGFLFSIINFYMLVNGKK